MTWIRPWMIASLSLGCFACVGEIGSPDRPDEQEPPAPKPGELSTSPGVRRLTRVEYKNTIKSLLAIDIDTDSLGKELLIKGHSQISGAQKTGYDDVDRYYELGDDVAAAAAPSVLDDTGCTDAACLEPFVRDFLKLSFRREPSEAVVADYLALFSEEDAGETLELELQTFLAAVLSSPQFLYRREIGKAVAGSPWRTLDGYEMAARMSYLIWQTTPDRELLDAAKSGLLDEPSGRAEELERMLGSDLAKQGAHAFVFDWLGLFDDHIRSKSPAILEGTSDDLPVAAKTSLELTVDDVLFADPERGKLVDLLRTDKLYANAEMASLLDLGDAPSEGFAPLGVDTKQRRGVLTHPLVIAAHSKEGGPSPFPIGKFVYENMLCETIPPPPATVPKIDAPKEGQTLRQELEQVTSAGSCIGCHGRISPPGFTFLPFDPIGRFSANDAEGRPWDTTGALLVPDVDEPIPFEGVADLSLVLADSEVVAHCAAKRLFRWTYGRFEQAGADDEVLAALEDVAVASETATFELLRAIVKDPRFAQVLVK